MNVLIVDDDIYSIEGLIQGVRWEKLKIEHIYKATDVQDAKQIIETNNINIMICDIEMPKDNGFILVQYIIDAELDIIVLLYSCHADFIYAKRALEFKVFDYILKPSPFHQIETVLEKSVLQYNENRKNKINKIGNAKNESTLKEKFYLDLIDGNFPNNKNEILRVASLTNLNFTDNIILIAILHDIKNWDVILDKWNKIDLEFCIKNMACELFSMFGVKNITVFPYMNQFYLTLLEYEEKEYINMNLLKNRCWQMDRIFIKLTEYGMNSLISPFCYLEEIAWHVHQLIISSRRWNKAGNVIIFDDEQMELQENNSSIKFDTHEWYRMLLADEKSALDQSLDTFFNEVDRLNKQSYSYLEKMYHEYTHVVFLVLELKNININLLLNDAIYRDLKQKALWTSNYLRKYIEYLNCWTLKVIYNIENEKDIISQIKQYINSHLDQEITREELENIIFINRDYMSRLFKKEEGISLTQYIIDKKVQKAKELLKIPSIMISEAAEKVGYTNFPYFSKIFKRETGLSPSDYKKQFEKK